MTVSVWSMSWTVQSVTVCSCLPPLSGTCPVCTVKTEEEEAHLQPVSLPPLLSTVSHHMWVTRLGSVNRASFGELLSSLQACSEFLSTHRRALWSCESAWTSLFCLFVFRCPNTTVTLSQLNFTHTAVIVHYNLKNRMIKKMCIYYTDICPHPENWWSQNLRVKKTNNFKLFKCFSSYNLDSSVYFTLFITVCRILLYDNNSSISVFISLILSWYTVKSDKVTKINI